MANIMLVDDEKSVRTTVSMFLKKAGYEVDEAANGNDAIDMILSSGDCTRGGGGGRSPRPQEREIFDLWDKHGLNEADFPGGPLVAFIKQLRKFLN